MLLAAGVKRPLGVRASPKFNFDLVLLLLLILLLLDRFDEGLATDLDRGKASDEVGSEAEF